MAALFPSALVALACVVPAGAAEPSPEPVSYGLRLAGTHGYTLTISARSESADGRGSVTVGASRRGAIAFYTAEGTVTTGAIHASLGALGRIDVRVEASGREKRVQVHQCGTYHEDFEPGVAVGSIRFRGEDAFTTATARRAPLVPGFFFPGFCSGGYGESIESGNPGARLKGVSYAGGRILKFQVNENRPGAEVLYSASLSERRGGIRIFRELRGTTGPGSFRFDRQLRTAKLAPPAPFAGSASTRRSPDAVSPLFRGDLTLDFPGHADYPLAGPRVHVSLVHARRTPGSSTGVSY